MTFLSAHYIAHFGIYSVFVHSGAYVYEQIHTLKHHDVGLNTNDHYYIIIIIALIIIVIIQITDWTTTEVNTAYNFMYFYD